MQWRLRGEYVKLFGMRSRVAGAAVGFAVLATGCGTAGASGGVQAPATATAMICRTEAVQEIDSAVGVPAKVTSPTWSDHLYSCTYTYPSGSMQLSVKELSDLTQTNAYYRQLGARMGDAGNAPGLGQGAFHTTNGSIVVRKDSKVLLVNVSGLPNQFGVPPTTSGNVALTVANVIMACWSGN